MVAAAVLDNYTTVKNISGKTLTFSYLGQRGKRLADGDTYVLPGDLRQNLARDLKRLNSLESDLLNNRLEILSTPPPLHYDANPLASVTDPSVQATANATAGGSSGGFLAAGTYYVGYTFATAGGETTTGTSVSTLLTVSAGNIPRVTVPALPTNATSIKIYLSAAGGLSTALKLYKSGVTTTTTDLTIAHPLGVSPPVVNTSKGNSVRATKVDAGILGLRDPSWGVFEI